MPLTVTKTSTTGTSLRSVSRIDQKDWNAHHLRFVADAFKKQTVWKLMQSSVEGFAVFLALLKLQVPQSQDGIGARPNNEAFGDRIAVGLGEVSLAKRQPFQHSANASRVLALCLTLRQLFLQPCHFLAMLLSPNPQLQPAFKEDISPFLYGDKQIRFVSVSADQNRTFPCRLWERHAKVANKLTVFFLDRQAVKRKGVKKVADEVVRDRESQSFSPSNCPNADCAIFFDGDIPFPLTNEEDSEGLFEGDGIGKFSEFSFGIASSDEADGSASHLGADSALNLMVGMFVKGTSGKVFAAVPANWRQDVADFFGRRKGLFSGLGRFQSG